MGQKTARGNTSCERVKPSMKQHLRTAAVALASFALGLAVTHLGTAVRAAAPPLQPTTIDVNALTPATLPPPSATFPQLQSKTVVVADGMTLAIQMGTALKHQHYTADEIQYVIEGTGTEALGDKTVDLKPGTLVVIPRNTTHAGLVATSGMLKFISIKTPPQDPSDVHFVQ